MRGGRTPLEYRRTTARVAARPLALEDAGVLRRTVYQNAPQRFDNTLAEAGWNLPPVANAMLAWGSRHAISADGPDWDRRRHAYPPIERKP